MRSTSPPRAGKPAVADRRSADEVRLIEVRSGIARGWAFTPQYGKRCFRTGWQSEPAAPLNIVEQWALAGNVALRTGSVSRVIVLDDDTPAQNADVLLALPVTVTVLTGSEKRHHYFRHPGFPVRNSTGRLLHGVDVKGDSGAVTFVGSIHPDTRRMYRWAPGLSPDNIDLAALPDDVIDRLRPRTTAPASFKTPGIPEGCAGRPDRYAAGALRGAALRVFDAAEGTRNSTLNREAFALARFVAAGLLARERVEDVLAEAARASGLGDLEVTSTLRSALDSGLHGATPAPLLEVRR